MSNVLGLRCTGCGKEFGRGGRLYVCDSCGKNLDVVYDYAAVRRVLTRESLARDTDRSIWRYRALFPLEEPDARLPLEIGWTPLYDAPRLAAAAGVASLLIKDDGRMPSASFKDRASAIAILKGLELGFEKISGASTGNAASSTACLCASIGMSPIIFVPETAPKAKIAQLLVFGARVFAVRGTYDDAFDLCLEASSAFGWYNRNTGYNPYTREGKKSCSFELCEQLGWSVPDAVAVPVGDGNIISGVWKGFRDLLGAGLIGRPPRLIAVQSENSSSVADAVNGDGVVRPVKATTIADSISVDMPRDGDMAVRAVRESGGLAVKVSDEEILETIKIIARGCGVFSEPAGATSVAGVMKLARTGKLGGADRIVCLVTGNGLKDVDSAMKIAGKPVSIEPNLEDLKRALE